MVGQVEPVEVMSTILRYENPTERDKFSAAGRVLLRDGTSRVTEGQKSSYAHKIQGLCLHSWNTLPGCIKAWWRVRPKTIRG